jgi:hypothetical protein
MAATSQRAPLDPRLNQIRVTATLDCCSTRSILRIDLERDPVASDGGVAVVSKPITRGEVRKIAVIGAEVGTPWAE